MSAGKRGPANSSFGETMASRGNEKRAARRAILTNAINPAREAVTMRGQLRIYTINEGQMDGWLEQFDSLISAQAAAGITVRASWVEVEKSQFGWIRTFAADDVEDCEAKFYGSAFWDEVVEKTRSYISNVDVTEIELR
jgi:hypothetical protein